MSLVSFGALGQAFDGGKFHYQYSFKATVPAPTQAGLFVDCNQSSGQPKYNPLAGAEKTANLLVGSGNDGLFTGPNFPGDTKYLLRWQAQVTGTNSVPMILNLCDYLLFYPLIDCDDVDVQSLDNTLTLSRFQSGVGVRAVFIATAPMAATTTCTMTYTNQSGVSGRVVTFNVIAATGIGVCAASAGLTGAVSTATPFLPLAQGDTGIRLVESVQFSASAGGFLCLALVMPIAELSLMEVSVPNERTFGFEGHHVPEIHPNAYLNFLIHRGAGTTETANLQQEFIFING